MGKNDDSDRDRDRKEDEHHEGLHTGQYMIGCPCCDENFLRKIRRARWCAPRRTR